MPSPLYCLSGLNIVFALCTLDFGVCVWEGGGRRGTCHSVSVGGMLEWGTLSLPETTSQCPGGDLFPPPSSLSGPHCVSFSIQSEVSFEGAYGNLKRLYDKAARMYHQLKKCETRRLSPSRKR